MTARRASSDLSSAMPPERLVSPGRLAQLTALAAAVALVGNAVVRILAVEAFDAPAGDDPLRWGLIVANTLLATVAGSAVYGLLGRFTARPVTIFRVVASVALLLSMLGPLTAPDLAGSSRVAGAVMHVVVAASVVGILTTRGRADERGRPV